MSKKSIQSRKFLEKQVKLVLSEQPLASGFPYPDTDKMKIAIEKGMIDILQGLYEPFVAIGNQIINKLYGGNLEQALGSLNYDKEAGSKKNFEDLKSVKDFFILFSEPNLADQRLGLKNMGDYLDPKFAKPSKYLKKYLSFINTELVPQWNQAKNNKNQKFSAKLYTDLYKSIYSKAPRTRGSVLFSMRGTPAGQHSTITDIKTLKKKNFFNIAAKLRMPFAHFAILCLNPFQEFISNYSEAIEGEQFKTIRDFSNLESAEELLNKYKDYFVNSLDLEDKEILKNTFIAFSVAKLVDPSGGTPLSKWYQIVSRDPPNMKIGGKSFGRTIAKFYTDSVLDYAEWKAMASLLEKTIKKPVNFLSWWSLVILSFYMIDPLKYLDTGFPISLPDSSLDSLKIFKAKIPGAVDNTLKAISDIEKTKPRDSDWFFTSQENETWRREFSEIEKVIKKELETAAAIKVLDSAAKKYQTWKNIRGSFKEMFTLMRRYLQLEINKDNIEQNKEALKDSKNLMIDFYNQVRVPDTSFLFKVTGSDLGSETNESMETTIINRKQLSSIVSKILLEQNEEETEAEKKKKKEAQRDKKIKDRFKAAGEAEQKRIKIDGDLYKLLNSGLKKYFNKHKKFSQNSKVDIPDVAFPIENEQLIKNHGLTSFNVSKKLSAAQGLWKKAQNAEQNLTMDILTKQFSKKYEQIFPTSLRKSITAKFRKDIGDPEAHHSLFIPGEDGFTPAISKFGLYHQIESLDVLRTPGVTQVNFPIYCYYAPRLFEGRPNSSIFILTGNPGEASKIMYYQSDRKSAFANTKNSASKTMRIDSLDKLFPVATLSQRAELHRLRYKKALLLNEKFSLDFYMKKYTSIIKQTESRVETMYITAMRDYIFFLGEMTQTADYLGKIGEANQKAAKILAEQASKPRKVFGVQDNERIAAATMMVHLEKLSVIDKALKEKGLNLAMKKYLTDSKK